MNRRTLQQLSRTRQREATALLEAGHHSGAYYLLGYAVECALKSCIARETRQHDFPDRRLAQQAQTHDVQQLVRVAGIEIDLEADMKISTALNINWAIVKDWSSEARYRDDITDVEARDLMRACTARGAGVLPWIRKRW